MKIKELSFILTEYEDVLNKIKLVVENNNCTVKFYPYKDLIEAKISNGYTIKIFKVDDTTTYYFGIDPNGIYNNFGSLKEINHLLMILMIY